MSTKSSKPLVSCLMVTRARSSRFKLLQESVRCFLAQTFPNLELVILLDSPKPSDKRRMEAYVRRLGQPNIRLVEVAKKTSLGALRNQSIRRAAGDFICQWDDDDLSHPLRVERQMAFLRRKRASAVLLGQYLHLFLKERRVYWEYWFYPGLPGTVLMKKSAAPLYARLPKHEDMKFVNRLHRAGKVSVLKDEPYLYVYVFHGKNAHPRNHHLRMARKSCAEAAQLLSAKRELLKGIREAGLVVPGLKFCDKDGEVF